MSKKKKEEIDNVITQKTYDELMARGVSPAWLATLNVRVVATPPEIDVLVCARFNVAEGLLQSDNTIGKCDDCGHAIQYRPNATNAKQRLCMNCAAAEGNSLVTALLGKKNAGIQ